MQMFIVDLAKLLMFLVSVDSQRETQADETCFGSNGNCHIDVMSCD